MKERRGFGGETIMLQMVNLSALMMCKPAQQLAGIWLHELVFQVFISQRLAAHQPHQNWPERAGRCGIAL
jgi:hypothetical protein